MRPSLRTLTQSPLQGVVNFSSKRGNKNFYKGRGGRKYGKPGPRGGFIHSSYPDWRAPDLSDFPLKAYVAHGEGLRKVRKNRLEHLTLRRNTC